MKQYGIMQLLALVAVLLTSVSLGISLTPTIYLTLSAQGTIDPLTVHETIAPDNTVAIFDGKPIATAPLPFFRLAQQRAPENILGDTSAEKRIEIDLTNQRLSAFEGDRKIYDFLVSTGKWGRTPTGEFRIWVKLRSTKMEGGSKALRTYYYLPNVPYTMFFANDQIPRWRGFGIHGTYWHDNFGHPMSHGCINMKTEEVAQIYQWAQPDLKGKASIHATADNPGTRIVIYGTAPAT